MSDNNLLRNVTTPLEPSVQLCTIMYMPTAAKQTGSVKDLIANKGIAKHRELQEKAAREPHRFPAWRAAQMQPPPVPHRRPDNHIIIILKVLSGAGFGERWQQWKEGDRRWSS